MTHERNKERIRRMRLRREDIKKKIYDSRG